MLNGRNMPATSPDARAALSASLAAADLINDPYLGVKPANVFLGESALAPGERWSRIEPTFVTEASGRRLEEYSYTPADGHRGDLPVAFLFEVLPDGRKGVIVYSDHHLVPDRAPIHPRVPDIHPWLSQDDVLFSYFRALNGNRLEDVLDQFEEDGYFRHSNDETFRGRDELRVDFTKMMGTSGIRVDYCRFTDDGTTCAAEVYMPSGRPAVAVYQRGRPGKLKAVRIYL